MIHRYADDILANDRANAVSIGANERASAGAGTNSTQNRDFSELASNHFLNGV
jgi:hypothetical protein